MRRGRGLCELKREAGYLLNVVLHKRGRQDDHSFHVQWGKKKGNWVKIPLQKGEGEMGSCKETA